MRRVFSLCAIACGLITLVVVGMLAHARRDDPAEWIIFSVNRRFQNDFDIYRVLSDGTHTARFAYSPSQSPSISRLFANPGWLLIYDNESGDRRVRLMHLLGHTCLEVREPSAWVTFYRYDRRAEIVYFTRSDEFLTTSTIWLADTKSDTRTSFQLPISLDLVRYAYQDDGYIVWSDYASAGDLFGVLISNPPQLKRLTTHGLALQEMAPVSHSDWLYYLVDDGDPDPYKHLYRIRRDGTGDQQVIEQVLTPANALTFWEGDSDTIHYWGGEEADPQVFVANLDGSQPTPLPIPIIGGYQRGWSPDRQWLYYTEFASMMAAAPFDAGDLSRVNLVTGEQMTVWPVSNLRQMFWSADGQWLILLTAESSGYQNLYKMRPDGSEVTLLTEDIRSYFLETTQDAQAAIFATWGEVGKELHMLDFRTLKIRALRDDAPPNRIRQFLTTLPMPDFEWQVAELVLMGLLLIVVGVGASFPPIRH